MAPKDLHPAEICEPSCPAAELADAVTAATCACHEHAHMRACWSQKVVINLHRRLERQVFSSAVWCCMRRCFGAG